MCSFQGAVSFAQLSSCFRIYYITTCSGVFQPVYVGKLVYGGDEENRTPDPLLARQVLSQLSYAPILRMPISYSLLAILSLMLALKKIRP